MAKGRDAARGLGRHDGQRRLACDVRSAAVDRYADHEKYNARLVEYNNDPDTSFAGLQKFFHMLEQRVTASGAADLTKLTDSVEIEIYEGGAGVIRTYHGWFPVTAFTAEAATMHIQFDGKHEVPPNAVDKKILEYAATVITSEAVWNRADDRQCAGRMPPHGASIVRYSAR